MNRIRLSPSASVTPTDAGVILRSDLGTFQLTGQDVSAFLEQMVPLLDGSRDEEALVTALSAYSRSSVTTFLGLLKDRGLVEEAPEGAERWRGPQEFFRTWSLSPADAMDRLARARVLCVGLEPWGASAAIELAAAGIGALHLIDDAAARRQEAAARIAGEARWCRVEASPMAALDAALGASRGGAEAESDAGQGGSWSLLVAAVPPGDDTLVERVARLAHRAGVRSLWSHLAGATAVLGPLVTPGRTACRICATADALNPPLGERAAPAPAPRAHAMGQLLGHIVAMEALRLISAYTPSDLGGRVLIEDLTTQETSLHTLVRLPRCRVCGEG